MAHNGIVWPSKLTSVYLTPQRGQYSEYTLSAEPIGAGVSEEWINQTDQCEATQQINVEDSSTQS